MERVRTDEFSQIDAPLVSTHKTALDGAEDIDGLKIIIYAEDAGEDMSWGFRFEGPPLSVNRAVDLFGSEVSIAKTSH